MSMRLGLGTVQFGSAYGISNTRGQVPEAEVAALLELAAAEGIAVLDTAAAYGESEAVLGRLLWQGHPFRIVTKTAPIASARIELSDVRRAADGFQRSLTRLRADRVYALLVHHAGELLRPGGDALATWLHDVKHRGLVSKIGFSCYTVAELELASAVLPPDIVQLPCNVLDRRFLESGHCTSFKARGAEVHARSVFLQGLLLIPTDLLPAGFERYRPVFERLDRFAASHNMSRMELALGFIQQCANIDVAVMGVTGVDELHELVQMVRNAPTGDFDYAGLACADELLLNPSLWPSEQPPVIARAT